MPEYMKPMAVLRKYFGQKEGQTLADFANECRALSEESKKELVTEAAKALGVEVEWS